MVLSEEGRDWFGLCLIPLSYPVSLTSLVFPMLAVCTLWNANNPWISLANPFAAASSATHPCTHWLSLSQWGPWPQGALDQYEPVTALFEQLGRMLYWPVAARDLFFVRKQPPWGFHSSLSARTEDMEMGKCQQFLWVVLLQGELCTHECLNTKRKLNASGVGYWKTCRILEQARTAGEAGDPPSWEMSRKMDLGCAVLNHLGLSVLSSPLSRCLYFRGVLKRNHRLQPWCFAE